MAADAEGRDLDDPVGIGEALHAHINSALDELVSPGEVPCVN